MKRNSYNFSKRLVILFEQIFRLNVSTKIMIPFFMVTIIVIASVSGVVLIKINEQVKEMERDRATSILASIEQRFQEEQDVIENYTRLLAYSGDLEQAVINEDVKCIYQILIPVKNYSQQQRIIVYGLDGKRLAEVSSLQNREEHSARIDKSQKGLVTSYISDTQEALSIYATAPIYYNYLTDKEDKKGVLMIEKHIGDIELMNIKRREGVDINLVVSGNLVASTLDPGQREKVSRHLKNTGSDLANVSLGTEKDYLNIWGKLSNNSWVSIMIPNDDMASLNKELTRTIVSISVLAIILVFFTSLALVRIMVGPLKNMLKITKAVTNGDFGQRIEILTSDEFGQLGESINFMAEKIKERLDEAEHLATVDGLTGLYNHRFFQQRLDQELARAQRLQSGLSLLFIDIDYFKQYNDNMGHPAGDIVLSKIGEILRTNIRGVDIAARYGGEEFAVILVDTGVEQAMEVSERIRQVVESFPFTGMDKQPGEKVTISIGIAAYPENALQKDDLIKFADEALYKAKHLNKNRVVLYHSVLDELKSELDQSDHDLVNTIKTLISVINSRDRYTYGHSERVVRYATAIADEMGLSAEVKRQVKLGAYLHDVGKIEIGREILTKTDPLSCHEMDIIKQHPLWGAEIVSPVNALKEILPVILYHHENYDGSGYPKGMQEEEIPLIARILRISDSYDAMTSARPYQETRTKDEAIEELINESGRQFDPVLVEIFLKCLEEGKCEGKLVS